MRTLMLLAAREGGKRAATLLEDAATACRAALGEFSSERDPAGWGTTQYSLGSALATLGMHHGDRARLKEAVDAFRAAVTTIPREEKPLPWAAAQDALGTVLAELGQLDEAAAAYRAALKEFTPDRAPRQNAQTQQNLTKTLAALDKQRPRSAA